MNNKKIQNIADKALAKKPTISKNNKKVESNKQKKEVKKNSNDDNKPEDDKRKFNELSFAYHFQEIEKLNSSIEKEQYIKQISTEYKIGIKVIKEDYNNFKRGVEALKNQKQVDQFELDLKEIFKLNFKPNISKVYSTDKDFLIYDEDMKLANLFVPFSFIETELNGEHSSYLKIKYKDGDGEDCLKDIIESASDFTKPVRVAEIFSKYSQILDSEKVKKVITYISDYTQLNKDFIAKDKGRLQTGWDKGTYYLPTREQNIVWLEPTLEHSYIKQGTQENELKLLKELAKGKVFINVLGAFASYLFGIVQPSNFFIHNGGLTGAGKSTAIKCALSFFGEPDKIGNNWNATLNGLETYWEQNSCASMWLDEMEIVKNLDDLINSLYAFFDGRGKTRAYSRDGEVKNRATKYFKGVCFSSGEKSIAEVQNMATNRNKPRGLTRRAIDLNITGLWDGIDFKNVVNLYPYNNGNTGVKYIEHLERNQDRIKKMYKQDMEHFSKIISNMDKIQQFGLLKTVLNIMLEMKFIENSEYKLQLLFLEEFALNEEEKIDKIKDIYSEFKDAISEFVVSNKEHFTILNGNNDGYQSQDIHHSKIPHYGSVDFRDNKISILPNLFKQWCLDNNFVASQVIETLDANNALKKDKDNRLTSKISIEGQRIRAHVFMGMFDTTVDISEIPVVYENIQTNETYAPAVENKNEEIPF